MLLRAISFPVHGALELPVGIAVLLLPAALGFGTAEVALSVFLGAVLIGLALGTTALGGRGTIPIRAHAVYDRALGIALVGVAVAAAIAGHDGALGFFLAAGLVQLTLSGFTRYSAATA